MAFNFVMALEILLFNYYLWSEDYTLTDLSFFYMIDGSFFIDISWWIDLLLLFTSLFFETWDFLLFISSLSSLSDFYFTSRLDLWLFLSLISNNSFILDLFDFIYSSSTLLFGFFDLLSSSAIFECLDFTSRFSWCSS